MKLQRLVWTGGAGTPMGGMLAAGALVWCAYAMLQLAVDGPVLDEALVPAQIITGAVSYPAGHPLAVFCAGANSLSYWLAAATWRLWPDAWALSASRNVVFLFASAFTPFALACVLTARPAWGHVAAVLTLSEAATRFIGVYLLWVFPGYWSSGHLGIHAAVLAAVLLVAGCVRSGALLLGVMPVLHIAMTLVAWPWAALYLLARVRGRAWRPIVVWGGVGLVVCAAVVSATTLLVPDVPPVPPYDAVADGARIFETFEATTDPHRQPIRLLSSAYLTSPIAFALLAALVTAGAGARDRLWLLLPGIIAWAYVVGARVLEAMPGGAPFLVQATMPGRYANLAVLYLLPLTVTAFVDATARLATDARRMAHVLLAALLVAEVALVLVDRRLAVGHLLWAAWGLLLAIESAAADTTARRRLVVAGGAALAASLLVLRVRTGEVGVGAFVAGLAAGAVGLRLAPHVPWLGWLSRDRVLAAAVVVAAVVGLRGPYVANGWDAGSERMSAWDARLAAWLATNATPGEPLLTPVWPPTALQAKTGHPVLIDSLTLLTMTYMPPLAAPIGTMVRDLFGIDYADPARLRDVVDAEGLLRPANPAWLAAWAVRSCPDWVRLGARYGVHLVLSPHATPLHLPAQLTGDAWTLYAIPAADGGCAASERGA